MPANDDGLQRARLLDAICRADFLSFVCRCFRTLAPTSALMTNWHLEALVFALDQVRRGDNRRLIINMPPRSLKSIVTSVAFPAFVLGHDPSKRIIAVSYGADLAIKHANDFRAVINSEWYRRLFPQMRISPNKDTELEVATTAHGYRLATSIEGTLTGRGGDMLIIDDPLKPIDALSDSKRERATGWYFNTGLSRLDDKRSGAIVVAMQRLHVEDLSGRLLRSSDEWSLLSLPAIADHEQTIRVGENRYYVRGAGELLHAQREPLQVLDSLKAQLGSDTFAAQYQQSPVPPGGAMIKRDWIARYDQVPERTPASEIVQSWDTASKDGGDNDWSVCTTWLIVGSDFYLIDVLRGRFNYPTLKERAIAHAQQHKPDTILVEDTGVGTALIDELNGAPRLWPKAVKPEHDKITRMSIQSAKFESGHVFLPKRAPWLDDLETELFGFPNARYDDQVDSISQALAHGSSDFRPYSSAMLHGLERLSLGLLCETLRYRS